MHQLSTRLPSSPSCLASSPSGHAHSVWLWLLHLLPWRWPQPPDSCGSVLPAKPAAPEALQPVDTSAQGWAIPQPARPLPFSPCEEATPEDGVLGLQEKEEPKATKVCGKNPPDRPQAMSEANIEAHQWRPRNGCGGWSGRTERPLRSVSHRGVSRAQFLSGAAAGGRQ